MFFSQPENLLTMSLLACRDYKSKYPKIDEFLKGYVLDARYAHNSKLKEIPKPPAKTRGRRFEPNNNLIFGRRQPPAALAREIPPLRRSTRLRQAHDQQRNNRRR